MAEISNKTLVGLLVVAIVISLAGTFISLNKLGQLGIAGLQLANVTQQTGTTQVTILGTASLTIYNNSIDWGSGQVNGTYTAGYDYCNLTTDSAITSEGNTFAAQGSGGKSSECDGFAATTPWSFVLENTGNIDFQELNVSAANGDAGIQTTFGSNAQFLWRLEEEDNSITCGTTGESSTFATVPTTTTTICSDFRNGTSSTDAVAFQMRFQLPEDALTDQFSDTLTFDAAV